MLQQLNQMKKTSGIVTVKATTWLRVSLKCFSQFNTFNNSGHVKKAPRDFITPRFPFYSISGMKRAADKPLIFIQLRNSLETRTIPVECLFSYQKFSGIKANFEYICIYFHINCKNNEIDFQLAYEQNAHWSCITTHPLIIITICINSADASKREQK